MTHGRVCGTARKKFTNEKRVTKFRILFFKPPTSKKLIRILNNLKMPQDILSNFFCWLNPLINSIGSTTIFPLNSFCIQPEKTKPIRKSSIHIKYSMTVLSHPIKHLKKERKTHYFIMLLKPIHSFLITLKPTICNIVCSVWKLQIRNKKDENHK